MSNVVAAVSHQTARNGNMDLSRTVQSHCGPQKKQGVESGSGELIILFCRAAIMRVRGLSAWCVVCGGGPVFYFALGRFSAQIARRVWRAADHMNFDSRLFLTREDVHPSCLAT
jgi:hypothetical protein